MHDTFPEQFLLNYLHIYRCEYGHVTFTLYFAVRGTVLDSTQVHSEK